MLFKNFVWIFVVFFFGSISVSNCHLMLPPKYPPMYPPAIPPMMPQPMPQPIPQPIRPYYPPQGCYRPPRRC